MAHFYVKNGGTATGDGGRYATRQTGSFAALGASGYYKSLVDVMSTPTTPVGPGDYIYVSDTHSFTYAATTVIGNNTLQESTDGGAIIISVSDTAIDTYSRGAYEYLNSNTAEYGFKDCTDFYGMDFDTTGWFSLDATFHGADHMWSDCTFNQRVGTTRSVLMDLVYNNGVGFFKDCTFTLDDTSQDGFYYHMGSSHYLHGGLMQSQGAGNFRDVARMFTVGFHIIQVMGMDLTKMDDEIINATWSAPSGEVRAERNQINTAISNPNGITPGSENSKKLVPFGGNWHCADTSASAKYEHNVVPFMGQARQIEFDTAFYRDNATAVLNTSQKGSYKFVSNTNVSTWFEGAFNLPEMFVEASTTAEDTITVYLLSADTLTDNDVWLEVDAPDATNANERVFYITAGSVPTGKTFIDPLPGAGTTLTTDASTWTGRTTENRYKIDLTLTGAGDGMVNIRVHFAKPSSTIYVCNTVELS